MSDPFAPFAFVRCEKLKTEAAIANAARHARGDDPAAKRRHVHEGPRAWAGVRNAEGEWETGTQGGKLFDLRPAFNRHLKRTGASLRKGTPRAMHLIVGISPDWLGSEAVRHNPESRRVKELVRNAVDWAEQELGGVWAWRYDLDERGSGVVDIFASPTARYRQGRGAERLWVSVSTALRNITAKHKARKSYSALQDSWHQWAQANMDPGFRRGEKAEITGRKHLTIREYKIKAEEAHAAGRQEYLESEQHRQDKAAQQKELSDLRERIRREKLRFKEIEERNAKLEKRNLQVDGLLKKKPPGSSRSLAEIIGGGGNFAG